MAGAVGSWAGGWGAFRSRGGWLQRTGSKDSHLWACRPAAPPDRGVLNPTSSPHTTTHPREQGGSSWHGCPGGGMAGWAGELGPGGLLALPLGRQGTCPSRVVPGGRRWCGWGVGGWHVGGEAWLCSPAGMAWHGGWVHPCWPCPQLAPTPTPPPSCPWGSPSAVATLAGRAATLTQWTARPPWTAQATLTHHHHPPAAGGCPPSRPGAWGAGAFLAGSGPAAAFLSSD